MIVYPSKFSLKINFVYLSLSRKKPERQLDDEHLDYLLSEKILLNWAGHPMKERVSMFSLKFPDKVISETALRNLYLKNGVRRKQIHIEKRRTPF